MKNRLSRIGIMLIIAFLMTVTSAMAFSADVSTTTSEDYIPSENTITVTEIVEVPVKLHPEDIEIIETSDLNELQNLMEDCIERRNSAHEMAEAARALNYEETHPVILLAKEEWAEASEAYDYYKNAYNDEIARQEAEAALHKWDDKMAEYPAATQIWLYLKDQGLNDYVCAGIIGNMMAEVGGQTLDIQYWLDTGNGYVGMCQWAKCYYTGPAKPTLEQQCDYLMSDIKYQIDTFGFCYKKGFNYDQFLQLNNEQDAALAFAKCYERCASQYVNLRARLATTAYNYFTA